MKKKPAQIRAGEEPYIVRKRTENAKATWFWSWKKNIKRGEEHRERREKKKAPQ